MKKRISVAAPCLRENEKRYVQQCLDTNWISSAGEFIPRFEKAFAALTRTRFAISCSSGTSALHLALLGLGIGPGDEVIVPTFTFIATANAVTYCGAKPVFVDSEPETGNLDPALLESLITPRTRAIVAVHLFGHPVDMDPVLSIAKKHGLKVIEDAAEAHGATYKNRPAGSLGDISTFSFYGSKMITTGEGGMICLNDPEIAARIDLLKNHGMQPDRRYWFPVVGYNYRMTNLQAAIGLAQAEEFDWHLKRRQEVARTYNQALQGLRNWIDLPQVREWASHSYCMYSVVLRPELKLSRDEFMDRLAAAGIETRPFFYPMHTLPPYLEQKKYPVAEALAPRGVSLPTHALLSEEEILAVAQEVRKLCPSS